MVYVSKTSLAVSCARGGPYKLVSPKPRGVRNESCLVKTNNSYPLEFGSTSDEVFLLIVQLAIRSLARLGGVLWCYGSGVSS